MPAIRTLLLFISLLAATTHYAQNHSDNAAAEPLEGSVMFAKDIDEMPLFPGCEKERSYLEQKKCADHKMLVHVYRQIKYPAKAREKGIAGTVVVSFIVEKDGSMSDIKLEQDLAGGCGQEVLRVVTLLQQEAIRWIPGRHDGQVVRSVMQFPINFKLE
ncbi:MAG: energy transducer TonB [Saprospiraceae bacterium]|nr:energy transducer TonB [Saprospiraceae bacterium]